MAVFKGIKLKMTAAMVAAVLATVVALTTVTYVLVSYSLSLSLRSRAGEISKILTEALTGRQRQLAIRAELITQDNGFQTNFAFRNDEEERLRKDLEERLTKFGASLATVADSSGKEISVTRDTKVKASLGRSSAMKAARDSNVSASDIETFDGQVFIVAATPIKQYDVQTIGYFAVATAFDTTLLNQLHDAAGAELLVLQNGEVRLGTCRVSDAAALTQMVQRTEETRAARLPSDKGRLLAWALPLRAGGAVQATLVFALSAEDANALQRRVIGVSLGVAILIIAVFGLIGLVIARAISDPIVEIEQSFREIATSGDLSRRITKPYLDEVGNMAASFNQMQTQIERLHSRVVAAETRMRSELELASTLQEMLFPTVVIDGARCQFASHARTSSETGGDWFTLLHAPEHHITTSVMCDVTGHGAPAALVTAIVHGFFKAVQDDLYQLSRDRWKQEVEVMLRRLNTTLIESTRHSLMCSLQLFTFDHRTLRGSLVNAGHLSPVLVRQVNRQSTFNVISTPPSTLIGDLDHPEFSFAELQLQPEDLFLLYTDGLIECTNPNKEMYGYKRLRRVLQRVGHQDARTVRDLVINDAMSFYGDQPPDDDITVIIGRVR